MFQMNERVGRKYKKKNLFEYVHRLLQRLLQYETENDENQIILPFFVVVVVVELNLRRRISRIKQNFIYSLPVPGVSSP